MRRARLVLLFGLTVLLAVGFVRLRGLGYLGGPATTRAVPLPAGDQEIAWINPATNGGTWERFVEGIRLVERQWPGLIVDTSNAFPEETTAVAEVVIGMSGYVPRLRIRWYKLTSDAGHDAWVNDLAERVPSPLALIGGGSSDRARDLALALTARRDWHGTPPLLIFTTATADQVYVDGDNPEAPLMEIYPERSFRFCFTNSQMAEAVRDLLWAHPLLRPAGSAMPVLAGWAAAPGDPWGALALFALGAPLPPPDVHIFGWRDDPYSLDLTRQFLDVFNRRGDEARPPETYRLDYSVGDYYTPNRPETKGLERLSRSLVVDGDQKHLLVLPAVEKPARRILRGFTAAEPFEARNVIALTGDSISLNVVYRDRHIAWDVRTMPMPVIFFAHQNPVAWPADGSSGSETPSRNATDDELLNADLVRVLVEAAFAVAPETSVRPALATTADELRDRLRRRQPAFFSDAGNRLEGSGEYVVCLRPHTDDGRALPRATLEVWTRQGEDADKGRWRLVKMLPVFYGGAGDEHGGR